MRKLRNLVVITAAAGVLSFGTVSMAQAQPSLREVEIDWYLACDQQGGRDPHQGRGAEVRCVSHYDGGTFTANAFEYCEANRQGFAYFSDWGNGRGQWVCSGRTSHRHR